MLRYKPLTSAEAEEPRPDDPQPRSPTYVVVGRDGRGGVDTGVVLSGLVRSGVCGLRVLFLVVDGVFV